MDLFGGYGEAKTKGENQLFAETKKSLRDLEESTATGRTEIKSFKIGAQEMGYTTEAIQETLADMARNKATYPQYLAIKKDLLTSIRGTTLRVFDETYEMYAKIGVGEKECKKHAKAAATAVKSVLEGSFDLFFLNQKQEVKRTY